MNLDEMRGLLADAPVARLATVDPDGRPNLVPIVYALDGDELLSVVDGKTKKSTSLRRVQNLRRDPRATVLVDHYEADWAALWWVRLRGSARIVESGADLARAKELLADKYPQYSGVEMEEMAVIIRIEDWLGWRMLPG